MKSFSHNSTSKSKFFIIAIIFLLQVFHNAFSQVSPSGTNGGIVPMAVCPGSYLSPSELYPGASGGVSTVNLVSSCPTYTVSESLSWVSWTKSGKTVTLTISANTGPERSGVVSIGQLPLSIYQACGNYPGSAGAISGTNSVCPGQTGVSYYVAPISNATGYSWTLPSGASIASGANTNSITVNYSSGSSSGNISVSGTGCGSGSASNYYVTVHSIGEPGSISGDNFACSGSTHTYSISGVTGATYYSWTLPPGASGASSSNSINVTFGTEPGYITVRAHNNGGCSSSTTSNKLVGIPSLVQYNVSGGATICQGETAPVSLAGSYAGAYYNLYLNGSLQSSQIKQGTGYGLTWYVSSAGTYTIKGVTQEGCEFPMVGSAVVYVNLRSTAATGISSTTPVCPNTNVVLTATGGSLGTGANWYWYANDPNSAPVHVGNPYTPSVGTTTTYYVKASGTCNETASISTTVTVIAPPTITQNPSNVTICSGGPTSFSVSASGATSYQWQQYVGGWSNISGATGSTYNISSTIGMDGRSFRCAVTGPCSLTTYSNSAVITFSTVNQYTVSLTGDAAICPGNSSSVTLNGSTSGRPYNLYLNGELLSSEVQTGTGGSLVWIVFTDGIYTVQGTSTIGCIIPMNGSATITLRTPSTPPASINASPYSVICPNEIVTLTLVGGSLEPGYGVWKWYSGSGPCGSVAEGEGVISINVNPSVTTTYYARAEGGCVPYTSCESITITVKDLPQITSQPSNSTIAPEGNAVFTVNATGPNLAYQWQSSLTDSDLWVNLTESPAVGYTTSSLTILGSKDFEEKFYRCRITSDCNIITSNSAKIIIDFPDPGYLTGSNIPDPETRILNLDLPVGSSNGSLDVSASGGATYTINLDVPPGVNGLAPALSLVYSGTGQGVPGFGWHLAGLSAINRGNHTFYNDALIKGVQLNAQDRLYLDGQRLINTSGNYGDANVQYQTEHEIFTRLTPMGVDESGPAWLKAETKSGLIIEYGNSPTSKQRVASHQGILTWYVSKISDLFGNEIAFKYIQDHNNNYPSEISYGPNKILFYYKERTDKNYTYFKGDKIEQWLLLDKITVSYNSNIIRSYELKHSCPSSLYNSYSILNEVIESGTGTDKFNSTAFSYRTPENADFAQTTYNTTHNYVNYNSKLVPGDYNGDGKTDFLCLPDPSKGASWTGMRIYFSDGNDNFTSYIQSNTSIDITLLKDIHSIDLNADGIHDIIYELGDEIHSIFHYMICNGTTLTTPTQFYAQAGFDVDLLGRVRRIEELQENDNVRSGEDYNGDGANDIFINHPDGNWLIKSFVNSSGEMTSSLNTIGSGSLSTLTTSEVMNGDFDGDGKPEIWCFGDTDLKIYSFDGTNLVLTYTASNITRKHFFTQGDFNGDGKVDLFMYGFGKGETEYDWADWQVRLSSGIAFETKYISQKKANLKDDYVRSSDFNGDGMSDIMVTSADMSWNGTYFYITKNYGTDLHVHNIPNYPYASHNFLIGDFNGDGNADFICTDSESAWWTGYQVYKTTGNNSILMNKATNGLGQLSKINYIRLSQASSSVYQKGTSAPAYPIMTYQVPFNVVESIRTDNGIGSKNSLTYYYEGSMIHLQGKGFLGFAKFQSKDIATGIENEIVSGYSSTYFYPKVLYSKMRLSDSQQDINVTSNSYSEIVLDASRKRILPYIHTSTESDLLTGLGTVSTFQFDNYGNPSSIEKIFYNSHIETTTNTYDNIVNTEKWLIGRPATTTVLYTKTGYSSISRSVSRSYDQSNNHLLSETMLPGTDKEYTKFFEYYASGNLKKDSIVAGGVCRVNRVSYEQDNIRLHSSTDVLSHTTTNTYDTYGRIYTKQDYLSNTATSQYDSFGRMISTSSSDGNQTTTAYNWEDSLSIPLKARYSILKSDNDGSQSKDWYDKLGRLLRSDSRGFDGTITCSSTSYNNKGQVYQVSDPYVSGSTPLWNTYSYDDFGRKIELSESSGRNTTWDYEDNSVTETTGSRYSTKTYSSDGTISSVSDPGGTISYDYFPDGKVKEIIAPGGINTAVQYDIAGNQTQLVDPSAGTITYSYNKFGELTSQTNPGPQNTAIQYYPDGRIYQKTIPEGNIKYRYNVNKQLVNISYPDGISKTYGYDLKGRITSITDTIPGTSPLITSFGYDALGRQHTITHPSGIVETTGFNTNGYANSVSAGGTVCWTVTDINARGQVASGVYGSNLTASFGYDDYGYPETISAGTIQYITYNFNYTTGNLNWRSDGIHNLREDFIYDDLDRLDSVYMGGFGTLKMTYGNNAGLAFKSDAGVFHYSAERPYALDSINPSSGSILTNQSLDYTSFQSIKTIDENSYHADFMYKDGDDRAKMTITDNSENLLTRYYSSGTYIKEVTGSFTKEYTFIGGDEYSAPVVAVTQGGNTLYYYLLRDHLGSVTHIVNSSDNTLAAEYSYDTWGRMRNPSTWDVYTPGSEPSLMIAGRGFTGHEHLPWFNMVNMNGRIYDPLIGMFISPDNYVQTPDNTQNFNRYVYCLNNPLKFTDPDGEFFIPMLIGAAINVITNGINNAVHDQAFFQGMGKSALIGGIGGALSFGIGQATMGMSGLGKMAFQTIAHGHMGGMMSGFNGGSYGSGFLSGAFGSLTATGTGTLFQYSSSAVQTIGIIGGGALAGGIGSEIAGGNFWDGFRNGAISSSLNHILHDDPPQKKPISLSKEDEEFLTQMIMGSPGRLVKVGKGISQSLGAGRTAVKKWLQNAKNLNRSQLVKDIESSGFKKVYDSKGMMHFERGGMKIRIDPPQSGTPFNHMHLNYGGNKSAYDIFLNPVFYKSSSAHIPIQ